VKQHERRFDLTAAATRLEISPRTLRDWIRQRLVRAVRKNPRKKRSPWLVPESEIDRVETERAGAG
jgi:predicted site-specific integrase-resolvase